MKFYPISSKGCREMALDRRTKGWTEGRTDEAVTICLLFGEHDKQYNYCKKKIDISKNCNFKGCGEMALDRRKKGWTEGRTDG